MKLRTIVLISTSFIIGIAAAIALLWTAPTLRTQIWGVEVIYAPTPTPLTGIESIMNLDAEHSSYRPPMPRDSIATSDFYITDYLETITWLESLRPENRLTDDVLDQFSRIDEVVTQENLASFYEDPTSAVNSVLGLVYAQLETSLGAGFKDTNAVSVCLALEANLNTGREIYLYVRVPDEVDARLDLAIPDSWTPLQVPPPENESWRSECFDEIHLASLGIDLNTFNSVETEAISATPVGNEVTDAMGLDINALMANAASANVIVGTISDDTPYTAHEVNVDQAGSTIVVDITAQDGDLDTLLYLVDEQNNIVAENDDRVRGNTNSLIVFPQAPQGRYQVIATRYKVEEGRSSGSYLLNLSVNPPVEVIEENYAISNEALIAAGFPDIEIRPEKEWTVLAYYGGDTNLEPGILNDFNEFELGLKDSTNVQVVMLIDRHPEFTDSNGNWSDVRLYEVGADVSGDEANFPPTIDSQPLAELGELNSGDGETFAQFLAWAMRHYPSQNYVIAFASHGAGWQGLITDDSDNHDILSVPELRRAFTTVQDELGTGKFALLINDACLMSSTEYYSGVAEFFDYSVASPEVVVDPALDMTLLTSQIVSATSLEDLGTTLVDTYINRDILKVESSDVQYLTYAVTKLDKYAAVTEAVNAFARLVNANAGTYYPVIGQARQNAYTYTRFLGDSTRIDLGDFMGAVIANTTSTDLIAAAQAVIDSLNAVRLYGDAGVSAARRTSYYNIYFPANSQDFEIRYFEESDLTDWAVMLRGYYNSVTPAIWETADSISFHSPIAPAVVLTGNYPTQVGSVVDSFRIGVNITGRNISLGDSTIDQVLEDGTSIRYLEARLLEVRASDDGGVEFVNTWNQGYNGIVVNWDVLLPQISDGTTEHLELLIVNEADGVAFLDGRYREPGSEQWNDVTVSFSTSQQGEPGIVQRIISRSEDSSALAAVTIAPGSEFQTFQNRVTEDGRVVRGEGNLYTWGETGLTWHWTPAPNGTYNLGMLMTASGGTTGFASTTVEVNNDGVNLEMRGDNRNADLGITLPRLANWNNWVRRDFNRVVAYRSSNDASLDSYALYFLYGRDIPTTFEERVAKLATDYGFTITSSDLTPVTITGYEGVQIDYSYENVEGVTVKGRAFVIEQTSNGLIYMVGAETVEGEQQLSQLYSRLTEVAKVFNPTGIVPSNQTATWRISGYDRMSQHPIPVAWLDGYQFLDGWDVYQNPEESSNAFIATKPIFTQARSARDILRDLRRDVVIAGGLIVSSTNEAGKTTESPLVAPGDNLLVQANRTLYSQYHQWEAMLYTVKRGDVDIQGRVYVMVLGDESYVVWVEVPANPAEDANRIMRQLEFVIDGYQLDPEWTSTGYDSRISHPIPSSWVLGYQYLDPWDVYQNPRENSLTFYANTRVATEGRSATDIVSAFVTDLVVPGGLALGEDANLVAAGTDFTEQEVSTYASEHHEWAFTSYTVKRGDVTVQGRIYATVASGDVSYVMWFETPAEPSDAAARTTAVFNAMLDGYQIASE